MNTIKNSMTASQIKELIRILLSAAIFILALGLSVTAPQSITVSLFALSYLIIGWQTLLTAARNIFHGQIFDENFLMTIASIGAFVLGEYPEAIAVMLFFHVGELFESCAVGKSRKSIASLMDIRPDYANLLKDGIESRVEPEEVMVGDIILIKPGEKVPLDGKILEGAGSLDTSSLTGEAMPRDVAPGDDVISGCINLISPIKVEVSKEYSESTVAKILDLVENASSKKANIENFITNFARYYTPIVVTIATALAVIPPLFITGQLFSDWVYRALTFLVISCPCALVISVPLSFFGGIGGASRAGILVKGSNYLEALARAEIVVFDKTGTLTKGTFTVSEIDLAQNSPATKDSLLALAAHAENYSSHPISLSVKVAYGKALDTSKIDGVKELAGLGVEAIVDGDLVHVGNLKLMSSQGVLGYPEISQGTCVHVSINHVYAGNIKISDEIKPDAVSAISSLKSMGIRETVMLTGDENAIGMKVANSVGIDSAFTQLLPADKVDKVEELLEKTSSKGTLVFLGDGINDAPVLARADIGVAMGGLGSDAAIEAADVVIMTDEPSKVVEIIKISKKTVLIAKQNVVFALAVKGVILILGAIGLASMWAAVFADVGVSVIAIMNAMRALKPIK